VYYTATFFAIVLKSQAGGDWTLLGGILLHMKGKSLREIQIVSISENGRAIRHTDLVAGL